MAMTLRLSDQDARRLRDRAEADGTSMQDVAVTAIVSYLDGRGRADVIDAALADTLARYGTALERLGE
jgi:predicted transcriptional regulator